MKEILIYLGIMLVCFAVFTGLFVAAGMLVGPILWDTILQATTEITQAITAGQLAK